MNDFRNSEQRYSDIKENIRGRASELQKDFKRPPDYWEISGEDIQIDTVSCYVQAMLENYRVLPEDSPIRKDIDAALAVHRKLCLSSDDAAAKKRHNALVLRYVIKKKLSLIKISQQIGINRNTLNVYLRKGIRELARICTYDFRLIPTGHGGRS